MHESDIRPAPIAGLEKTVGHTFENKELVRTALTHSSYSNEQRAHGVGMKCNERLEFLGDSVLSIIVSDYLFATHPDMPEGELSSVRAWHDMRAGTCGLCTRDKDSAITSISAGVRKSSRAGAARRSLRMRLRRCLRLSISIRI